jgi:hypothetical protein
MTSSWLASRRAARAAARACTSWRQERPSRRPVARCSVPALRNRLTRASVTPRIRAASARVTVPSGSGVRADMVGNVPGSASGDSWGLTCVAGTRGGTRLGEEAPPEGGASLESKPELIRGAGR